MNLDPAILHRHDDVGGVIEAAVIDNHHGSRVRLFFEESDRALERSRQPTSLISSRYQHFKMTRVATQESGKLNSPTVSKTPLAAPAFAVDVI